MLKSPALWSYGASYFFIKFVRYAILLWMPYYLANTLHYANDDANYISNAFEAGGMLGVIALGVSRTGCDASLGPCCRSFP